MKLKCGCVILGADGQELKPVREDGPESVQRQRITFCQTHHDKLIELITSMGGVMTPEGQTLIPAGELSVRVLNAIEKYIQDLIFEGLSTMKRPEENN